MGTDDCVLWMKISRGAMRTVLAMACLSSLHKAYAQTGAFTNWPLGSSPSEVGERVANHFVQTPSPNKDGLWYQEICTWYGALQLADAKGDEALRTQLVARAAYLLRPEGKVRMPDRRHVDSEVVGALPLEVARQTKDEHYRALGLAFADRQWESPTPEGFTSETRYWIDDMYMITILQVQAYRVTGDRKYIDRAALEMGAYLDKLQQPNGLFYHAPDVPYFWGRGDGWMAAGMTELLRSLPVDHPARPRILAGYRKMMAGLIRYQAPDGMWHQLIDHPEAWPETSSTGMFTFALISGVKNGWLDEATYAMPARRGWLALVGYIDQNADVTSVCAGTDKENSLEHYMQRPRRTGDFHGQAPVLWIAAALLRP
jgi:unsaturated rhamnogalacturonyl hydrolase